MCEDHFLQYAEINSSSQAILTTQRTYYSSSFVLQVSHKLLCCCIILSNSLEENYGCQKIKGTSIQAQFRDHDIASIRDEILTLLNPAEKFSSLEIDFF